MQSTAKTRTREVKFRLTEKELERLNNNVAMTGLSREQYLRVLVSRKIPMALPPADYRVLIRQMIWVEEELRKIREGSNPDEDMSMLEYTLQVLNNTIVLELDRLQSRIPTREKAATYMVKIPPDISIREMSGGGGFLFCAVSTAGNSNLYICQITQPFMKKVTWFEVRAKSGWPPAGERASQKSNQKLPPESYRRFAGPQRLGFRRCRRPASVHRSSS